MKDNIYLDTKQVRIDEEDGEWVVRALVSSTDVDLSNEIVNVWDSDLTALEEGRAVLNMNHDNSPENIVGIIDGYRKTRDELYVVGRLFQNQPKAQSLYTAFQNDELLNLWGMSIEGRILDVYEDTQEDQIERQRRRRRKKPRYQDLANEETMVIDVAITAVAFTLTPCNTATTSQISLDAMDIVEDEHSLSATADFMIDQAELQRTDQGYLRARARLARVGLLEYRNPDGSIRVELRNADETFRPTFLQTLRGLPITSNHPVINGGFVTSDNTRQVIIGYTNDDVAIQQEYLEIGITIIDEPTIQQILDGTQQEISLGYTSVPMPNLSGELFRGQNFDVYQTDCRANHVAVVPRGRAGANVRVLLDSGFERSYIKKEGQKHCVYNELGEKLTCFLNKEDANEYNNKENKKGIIYNELSKEFKKWLNQRNLPKK